MSDRVTTEEAAAIVGVAVADFTDLTQALFLRAAVPGSRTQSRLWDRAEIEALRDGEAGQEARALAARDAEVEAVVGALAEEFPAWRDAAGPAAEALFQFNRYAKWAACSALRRRALYELKDELLGVLVDAGYCQSIESQTVSHPDTGGETEFLVLTFRIGGRWYDWHTPRAGVTWAYTLSPPPADRPTRPAWVPGAGPKPIRLDAAEFVRAEAVVRYVIGGYEAERAAADREARRQRAEQMRAEGLARRAALREAAGSGE